MEPSRLIAECTQLKEAGNRAFKAGDAKDAFSRYSAAIAKLREVTELTDLNTADSRTPGVQLAGTLYSNRAAAALKLRLLEQAVHDGSCAMTLLLVKGISDAEFQFWSNEHQSVYVKARLRRATALLELGNLMQAHCDFMRGGNLGHDNPAVRRGVMLSHCLVPPIRWSHPCPKVPEHPLPPPPPKRSSANIDNVVVRTLRSRVLPESIFPRAVAWGGRMWMFGGGSPHDPFMPPVNNGLLAVDPAADTAQVVEVLPAAGCSRRDGVPRPRYRHTMVLWRDALFVYGGQLDGSRIHSMTGCIEEARTVWRLDLQAEPLRWERLLAAGTNPETRQDHSAVERRLEEVSDAWAFDLRQHSWRRLTPTPPLRRVGVPPTAPQPRREHAAWVHDDWMYIFGGTSSSVQMDGQTNHPNFAMNSFTFSSMWRLHLRDLRWEAVHYRGNFPAPLAEIGVAVDPRGTVYAAGGYSTAAITAVKDRNGAPAPMASAYSSEVFAFCPRKHWWRRLVAPDGQPVLGHPRAAPTACWLDGKLYVAGGYCGLSYPAVEDCSVQELDVRVCAACGATRQQTAHGKLQQCSGCKAAGRAAVYYCSTDCATKDWPVHRIICSDKGMVP